MSLEIKKLWNIISLEKKRRVEVRGFHYEGRDKLRRKFFSTDEYDSLDEFKSAVERFSLAINEDGFNAYITLNPIRSDSDSQYASDSDIELRDLLLIDIDRAGGTKQPASESELLKSELLASEVSQFLHNKGWGEPVRVMSGNGYHLYYRLDCLPNDNDTSRLLKKLLVILADLFDNDEAKIDRVVYNASRITKIPGTIMRKGIESDGRPFRMSRVL